MHGILQHAGKEECVSVDVAPREIPLQKCSKILMAYFGCLQHMSQEFSICAAKIEGEIVVWALNIIEGCA